MDFGKVKGYATRDTAWKKLQEAIAPLPALEQLLIERISLVIALPNGRFAPGVRFTGCDDSIRTQVNGLLFVKQDICLF